MQEFTVLLLHERGWQQTGKVEVLNVLNHTNNSILSDQEKKGGKFKICTSSFTYKI